MDRRTLLHRLGRQAAALALAQLFGPARAQGAQGAPARWPAGIGDPFTLGVASGMPRPDSVVIWTRLAPRPHESGGGLPPVPLAVRWELAEDERFSVGVRRGEFLARPEHAHAVHVEVKGLASGRAWFYRFIAGGAVSAVGRTRTAPAEDEPVARLRLALASCQHYEQGWYAAHREIAARELDFVLFVGDYIYESSNQRHQVRQHEGPVPQTLEAYRARHATYKLDADLRAAHAAHPWILTWDDHEVENDYAGLQGNHLQADFAAQRAAAYQAFYEHMPLRASVLTQALAGLASGAEMRIYGQVAFGRLATLFLLDDRQYRDPQVCNRDGRLGSSLVNPERCAAWTDPRRTLLGAAQEQWLDRAFQQAAGGATWNVLGQQTLFGRRDFRPGPGVTLWNDGWDGYEAARTRLTDSLQRHRLANPVLLGGDVHENWVGHVKADYARPDSAALGVEFCGTSISSRAAAADNFAALLAELEQVLCWAHRAFAGQRAPLDEGGEWDFDLQTLHEGTTPDQWHYEDVRGQLILTPGASGQTRHTVTLSLSGTAAFGAALRERFAPDGRGARPLVRQDAVGRVAQHRDTVRGHGDRRGLERHAGRDHRGGLEREDAQPEMSTSCSLPIGAQRQPWRTTKGLSLPASFLTSSGTARSKSRFRSGSGGSLPSRSSSAIAVSATWP